MWLIHTRTGKLVWFHSPDAVDYAILSHVWQKHEQTFQELCSLLEETEGNHPLGDASQPSPQSSTTMPSRVSPKIQDFCNVALRACREFGWIDTCCIDKTSSAELSEAINSMFEWYHKASVCYVYLHDVEYGEDPAAPYSAFRRSQWFTRAWTLQELIAPRKVIFLSKDWRPIGTKDSLVDVITEVTGIDQPILLHDMPFGAASVARRMSWAASREATREEDRAYSLLGIFGVNMPTIYGEGKRAFVRLQQEILRHSFDQSIFAWMYSQPDLLPLDRKHEGQFLLALSPNAFAYSADIAPIPLPDFIKRVGIPPKLADYAMTCHGLRTTFPIRKIQNPAGGHDTIAVLACMHRRTQKLLALILRPTEGGLPLTQFFLVGDDFEDTVPKQLWPLVPRTRGPLDDGHEPRVRHYRRIMLVPPELSVRGYFEVTDVCIPEAAHPQDEFPSIRRGPGTAYEDARFAAPAVIVWPPWLSSRLAARGVSFIAEDVDSMGEMVFWEGDMSEKKVRLEVGGQTFTIDISVCACRDGHQALRVTFAEEPKPQATSTTRHLDMMSQTCPRTHLRQWYEEVSKPVFGRGRGNLPVASRSFTLGGRSLHLTFAYATWRLRDETLGEGSRAMQVYDADIIYEESVRVRLVQAM